VSETKDWIQVAIERFHKPPAGWAWCRSEVIGDKPHDAFVIEGGIPRIISRGPRKGKRTWKGVELTRYVLSRAQVDEVK